MPCYARMILITGAEADAGPVRREHVAHLARLKAEGKLRAAGAFAKGEGYLEIFEAKDLLEAESIARSSPLVVLGLGTFMLREWDETPL